MRSYLSIAEIISVCEEGNLTLSKAEKDLGNGVTNDRTVEYCSFSTARAHEAK